VIILGLDPGDSTGVVVCTVEDHMSTFAIPYHGVVSLWRGIETIIDTYHPNVAVAEQYKLYPHLAAVQSFSTMVAARVLGAIEEIMERRGIPLVEQSASIGTRLRLPDNIFNLTGKYWAEHEKDSVKHVVAYCYGIGIKE
jgi:hypothetical protein